MATDVRRVRFLVTGALVVDSAAASALFCPVVSLSEFLLTLCCRWKIDATLTDLLFDGCDAASSELAAVDGSSCWRTAFVRVSPGGFAVVALRLGWAEGMLSGILKSNSLSLLLGTSRSGGPVTSMSIPSFNFRYAA